MKFKYNKKIEGLCFVEDVFYKESKVTAILFDNNCNLITDANEFMKGIKKRGTDSFNTLKSIARQLRHFYNFITINKLDINKMNEENLIELIKYLKIIKIKSETEGRNDFKKVKISIENTLFSQVQVRSNNKSNKIIKLGFYSGLMDSSIGKVFARTIEYLQHLYNHGIYKSEYINRFKEKKAIKNFLNAQGVVWNNHLIEPIEDDFIIKPEEIELINNNETTKYERLLYFILERTGIRVGECLGLKIENYDLDNLRDMKGDIIFNNGRWLVKVVWRPENEFFCRTKSHRSRVIELKGTETYAFEIILSNYLKWRKKKMLKKGSQWLMISSRGTQLTQNVAYSQFKRTLARCELNGMITHTLHHYRHTLATNELLKGTPIEFVSKMLGHRKLKTTQEIYVHYTPGKSTELREKLEKKWKDGVNGYAE